MLRRTLVLLYGVIAYAIFVATFAYAYGFIANVLVPKSMDSGATGPLATALLVDVALLGLFAIQHSVMARPGFKRWWTRFVPEPIERSTYTLLSSVCLILLFWQWRPIDITIWDLQSPVARGAMIALCAAGFGLVFVATCLIHHFDLFGLRQVWLYFRGKEYAPLHFRTPGPYRIVRHPLYVGWFVAFFATPTMTLGHFVFALTTAAYILVAIRLEERDLVRFHAEYAEYRRRVPMLIPRRIRKSTSQAAPAGSL